MRNQDRDSHRPVHKGQFVMAIENLRPKPVLKPMIATIRSRSQFPTDISLLHDYKT